MTTFSKTALKTFFETGDVPTGQNFADFIDSCVNLAETSVQTMAGAINPTEVITARVSAGAIKNTGNTELQGNVSAGRLWVSSSAHVSALDMRGGRITNVSAMYSNVLTVNASGTTQATAAPVTAEITIAAGLSDGEKTGFILLGNQTGRVQYIINAAASANLYPCVGGQINTLASNAAFGMAANTPYVIIHTRASGYAVK